MIERWIIIMALAFYLASLGGCSSMKTIMGVNDSDRSKPIGNPFGDYRPNPKGDSSQNMILRTKRGDRSVEIEIPGDSQKLSEFVLPVSPAFKDSTRSPASSSFPSDGSSENQGPEDPTRKRHGPTLSDHEIVRNFPQGLQEDTAKRAEIEESLHLTPTDDEPLEQDQSYLGDVASIKNLYRSNQYELALIRADDMIVRYPTAPKLYQMRGTLLDRLGHQELAIQAWNQALKLDPKNQTLQRFIERRQLRVPAGVPR